MKVQNKVIVVTGGGSGLGRELVLHLLEKGAKVIAVDINEEALNQTLLLADQRRDHLSITMLDITNSKAVRLFVNDTIDKYGVIDGLINNAGIIQPFLKLNDLGYDAIERVINVNLFGTLFMTKEILRKLLFRPEAHIVNVSSLGGFLPVPGQTMYGASKAAVKIMTEGLSAELAQTNVKVSLVIPGAMRTHIIENSGLTNSTSPGDLEKASKILSPKRAAEIILKGMEKDQKRIMVGKDSKILDFFYRLNPAAATAFISRKMKGKLE